MAEEFLSIYTIYKNPRDYPGKYVVREHMVGPGFTSPAREPMAVVDTLEEARAVIPPDAVNLGRNPADEQQIVESWM